MVRCCPRSGQHQQRAGATAPATWALAGYASGGSGYHNTTSNVHSTRNQVMDSFYLCQNICNLNSVCSPFHAPIYLVQSEPTSRLNKRYRNKIHKWQHFELKVFNLVTYLSESKYLYLNPCRVDSLKTYLFMKTFLMLAELLSESESHDIKVQTRFLSG